ncbi:MAG: hypothetical protein LBI75_01600 [Brucellaceae bacterium]|nr:hypothetical protein [Brucellaceae bacterium]
MTVNRFSPAAAAISGRNQSYKQALAGIILSIPTIHTADFDRTMRVFFTRIPIIKGKPYREIGEKTVKSIKNTRSHNKQ